MRHGAMSRTTFTARPSSSTKTASMSKRMNIVWIEKQGAMISALAGSRPDAAEQPLAAIAPGHGDLDAIGERLVGALIDQRQRHRGHQRTSMRGTFLRGDDCARQALRLVVVQEIRGARRVEILAVERRLLLRDNGTAPSTWSSRSRGWHARSGRLVGW